MGGGLMQIVSYGSQDEYITGTPDITFFKVQYRKHANFAVETIEQTLNLSGNDATCTISRSGDLLLNCWIECTDGDTYGQDKAAGSARNGLEMVKQVDLLIGNQVIDTHYGDWYDIWYKLSVNRKNIDGYEQMLNKARVNNHKAFVPLQFFFCKNKGLALPLIALKYHEVSLRIKFADNVTNKKVWTDYVYLEQEDRVKFAQMTHEILIEQLQFSGEPNYSDNGNKYLRFSHPVKELIWTYAGDGADPSDVSKIGKNISIKLNEYYKIKDREDMYFTHIQPYQHHTNIPTDGSIYVYSFALQPEDYQPSGTCNFSRLKFAQILSETGRGIKVYAVNYNILKITSGMAGLLFPN